MVSPESLSSVPPQELSHHGIGASEAAGCLGLSPFEAPIDRWMAKTGRKPPFAGNEQTFWGHALEPLIRAHYVETNKLSVHVPPSSLYHRDHKWLRATPDGIVVDSEGHWLYVGPQVKNVGLRQAPAWEDGPPEHYVIQAVVEMAVTDLDRLDFGVLIGGQHYAQYTVHRDLDLENAVIGELNAFWRLVELDKPPPLDGSEGYRQFLLSQIKRKAMVAATSYDLANIERWREIALQMHDLKEEEKLIKNKLAEALASQDANRMTSPLGDITVSAPSRRTSWKSVAEELSPMPAALGAFDRELQTLRASALMGEVPDRLAERIDGMRASVKIAATFVESYNSIVERHTGEGARKMNRPKDWTASSGDDE